MKLNYRSIKIMFCVIFYAKQLHSFFYKKKLFEDTLLHLNALSIMRYANKLQKKIYGLILANFKTVFTTITMTIWFPHFNRTFHDWSNCIARSYPMIYREIQVIMKPYSYRTLHMDLEKCFSFLLILVSDKYRRRWSKAYGTLKW